MVAIGFVLFSSIMQDQDDPFFVADLGRLVHLQQLWTRTFPRIKPFYGVCVCVHNVRDNFTHESTYFITDMLPESEQSCSEHMLESSCCLLLVVMMLVDLPSMTDE